MALALLIWGTAVVPGLGQSIALEGGMKRWCSLQCNEQGEPKMLDLVKGCVYSVQLIVKMPFWIKHF